MLVPRSLRSRAAVAATVLSALALCAAPAAGATTTVFSAPGEQAFVVPAGVSSLHIVAIGARGGNGGGKRGGSGAFGDRLEGDLGVTPGQVLYVEVGGPGGNGSGNAGGSGGVNGGGLGGSAEPGLNATGAGGGGGASDLRTLPVSKELESVHSRLLVAGGGGGGGGAGSSSSNPGGASGGAAGQNGATALTAPDDYPGGSGGGGATATTPGKGGSSSGSSGALGRGGSGEVLPAGSDGSASGGGGGGGAFGGGSGGTAEAKGGSGGGGGGGSDLFGPLVTGASVVREATEPAVVTLTYTAALAAAPVVPPPLTPVVAAPQTKLKKHPGKLVETTAAKAPVSFGFVSSIAGSSFGCRLDKGRFKPCKSPQAYEVAPGAHVFKVAASTGGVADPTPAVFRFKVQRAG